MIKYLLVSLSLDIREGTIKPSVRTITQYTGRGPKQEKLNLIAEGGSFIAQIIRDHKTN